MAAKLPTIIIVCMFIGVNLAEENASVIRNSRSADFFSQITAPIYNFFGKGSEAASEKSPVAVPALPVWKIHKYNGVHLKPVSSIPYIEASVPAPEKKKLLQLPSLERIKLLLGTTSNAETFDAIREMVTTREGLKLIASYIKSSGNDDVDVMNMKKEDVDNIINYYQYSVPSTETAKPPTEQSFISKIKSQIASKFNFGSNEVAVTEKQVPVINHIPQKVFHQGPRGLAVKPHIQFSQQRFVQHSPIIQQAPLVQHVQVPYYHQVPYVQQVPIVQQIPYVQQYLQQVPFVQQVPVYIVPQIIKQDVKEKETGDDDSDGAQHLDAKASTSAPNLDDDSSGNSETVQKLPDEDKMGDFKVEEKHKPPPPPVIEYGAPPTSPKLEYGAPPPKPEYGPPPPPPKQEYGDIPPPPVLEYNAQKFKPENRFSPIVVLDKPNDKFFTKSASIQVGSPIDENNGIGKIIPFPILKDLPALPEPETLETFQLPNQEGPTGSFRFLPINQLVQSEVLENTVVNPSPKTSVFSFSSEQKTIDDDRQVIETKIEQPGFTYTQLNQLPLEKGVQFNKSPGQISSFGDQISSHIFEEDPLEAASEQKPVVVKSNIKKDTKSGLIKKDIKPITTTTNIRKNERPRWVPKSKKRPESKPSTKVPDVVTTESIPVASKPSKSNS